MESTDYLLDEYVKSIKTFGQSYFFLISFNVFNTFILAEKEFWSLFIVSYKKFEGNLKSSEINYYSLSKINNYIL